MGLTSTGILSWRKFSKNLKKIMREIYFKIKQNCELPLALLTYSYKESDGVIHPFRSICVDFKDDENNIKQMEAIKEKYGQSFMFFNNSDDGIDFWKNNPITMFN